VLEEKVLRSILTMIVVLSASSILFGCGQLQDPGYLLKGVVGRAPNPQVDARSRYDQSVADYQKCLAANPSNANACEGQRAIIEAAGPSAPNANCSTTGPYWESISNCY
jgi:hypothetical protein